MVTFIKVEHAIWTMFQSRHTINKQNNNNNGKKRNSHNNHIILLGPNFTAKNKIAKAIINNRYGAKY